MKKVFILFTLIFSLTSLTGQTFSGSLEFRYVTPKDTNVNMYLVKNKMVRLDQYGRKGNVDGSYLFDLSTNEMKWTNPKRKLWGYLKSETPQVIRGQCVVTKGTGTKTIAGQKCVEYTVKNTEENTVVTYWIAEGKFSFFIPMVKLWNKKDKQSIYFGQIKGLPEGSMPMASEERQLSDNKVLTTLEVLKVVNTPPSDASFTIPAEYEKFNSN